MSEPTSFMESNALLAVQNGDENHARDILDQLLPNERRVLAEAAHRLGILADVRVCPGCAKRVGENEDRYSIGLVPRVVWHRDCFHP